MMGDVGSPGLSPISGQSSRCRLSTSTAFSAHTAVSAYSNCITSSAASLPYPVFQPNGLARPWRRGGGSGSPHVYENPAELVAAVRAAATTDTSSTMSWTLSSASGTSGNGGPCKGTLSSEGGCSLSPGSRLRLATELGRRGSPASDEDSGCALDEFAWVPSGLRPDLVHQYFSLLPEDRVPYQGSAGEKWRVRQLLLQLPPQDSESRYCRNLSPTEARELRQFVAQRKKEAIGRGTPKILPSQLQGTPCHQCGEGMRGGELGVFCGRLKGAVWHPACFGCGQCGELLVDLIYFATPGGRVLCGRHHAETHKPRCLGCDEIIFSQECTECGELLVDLIYFATPGGRVLCGRHHAETHKPRCLGCDEIIFSQECTEAEGGSWHLHHFACLECEVELGGQRYVMRDDRPYCLSCFHGVFPDLCIACRRPIANLEPRVTLDSAQWHANDTCYSCAACRMSLLGKPALPSGGRLFCSRGCAPPSGSATTSTSSATTSSSSASSPPSQAVPRSAAHRRPPPLQLPVSVPSSDEGENDYETVPSFRASPPSSHPPTDFSQLRHQMDRMTMSVHQDQEDPVNHRRHRYHGSRRNNRKHHSLTDLRASDTDASPPCSSGASSSRRSSRPSVTFSSSARDPRPSKKSKRSGRCRRGTSAGTGSERSYAKAVGGGRKAIVYHGGRLNARFRDSGELMVGEEPAYAAVGGRSRSPGACSTCSSSSSEDEGGADYLTAELLLAGLRSRSASLRRRGSGRRGAPPPAPPGAPPATPARRKAKPGPGIRDAKLASARLPPASANCIVS